MIVHISSLGGDLVALWAKNTGLNSFLGDSSRVKAPRAGRPVAAGNEQELKEKLQGVQSKHKTVFKNQTHKSRSKQSKIHSKQGKSLTHLDFSDPCVVCVHWSPVSAFSLAPRLSALPAGVAGGAAAKRNCDFEPDSDFSFCYLWLSFYEGKRYFQFFLRVKYSRQRVNLPWSTGRRHYRQELQWRLFAKGWWINRWDGDQHGFDYLSRLRSRYIYIYIYLQVWSQLTWCWRWGSWSTGCWHRPQAFAAEILFLWKVDSEQW